MLLCRRFLRHTETLEFTVHSVSLIIKSMWPPTPRRGVARRKIEVHLFCMKAVRFRGTEMAGK